ncbi:LysR family transcriptional regulator [Thermostichus vulcanus]|uniref:LysR family transcriptional regulator n=1 Tax=Thermostichus vulcanus str. 'Rupite' TaxID=2813851 RepID=A0ABT0C6E8_THEVL|nr:LysR family transcriptional regulator [Thermostichus vulcanus]MCJ2541371.1 LysR family transcriptional regulator [Thermostichus vulcanus str. 'Rupite']
MELYQLKVFLEVARHLSFTEAADALHLTQPAVSAKIKSLESELDVTLFHRLGRKIQLTEMGQCLVEEGSKLLALEQQVINRIQDLKSGKHRTLRIGCTALVADEWLPSLLFRYRSQHPNLTTQCLEFDNTELLYRAIIESSVDLGISDIEFREFNEISATAVDTIVYGAFVRGEHPHWGQTWLSIGETLHQPWVVLAEGSPSRLVFESRLAEVGIRLSDFQRLETVDSLSLMRTYIMQGGYLGFGSSLEFVMERQAQLMGLVPLQEFALEANLYLLQPRRLTAATAKSDQDMPQGSAETAQAFLQFLRTTHADPPAVPSPPSDRPPLITPPQPMRLRSPSFGLRSHSSASTEVLKIVIGTQNSTIHSTTAGLVIRQLGLLEHFLPREGRYSSTHIQIEWQDFTSGSPIVQRLRSEQLDFGVLGDYPLLLTALQLTGSQQPTTHLISFVAINPNGRGNAVIVPQGSQLSSIEDLRGRTIAVPWESSAHGMIIRVLGEANLLSKVKLTNIDDLTFNFTARPHRVVDGYGHFAPFWEIARRQGQFRQLFDGHATGLPAFHGVVVRSTFAEDHPDIVVAYLRALRAAQYWYVTTPSAPNLVGQWLQLDPHVVAHVMPQEVAFDYPKGCPENDHTGLFFQDATIRSDWLKGHLSTLQGIPGSGNFVGIDLNSWVRTEFMEKVWN